MARPLDPATRRAIAARLRFYRDLGLTEFYRRPVDPALFVEETVDNGTPALALEISNQESSTASQPPNPQPFQEEAPISAHKPLPPPPQDASVPLADRAAALQLIRDEIGDCTRCALHKGRNKLVFGDGIAHGATDVCGRRAGRRRGCAGHFHLSAAPANCSTT